MPFSPHEIEKKEFVLSFRGYDRREVRAFLRAAAADYRAALGDAPPVALIELESRARSFTGLVSAAEEVKRNIELSKRRAEIDARAIRESAERDARRILSDAQREAEEAGEEAERAMRERLDEVVRKTGELRALEARMKRRLYFLETALELARRDLGGEAAPRPLVDDASEFPVSAEPYLSPKLEKPA
jgi:DivIVA domain-containing protein